MVDPLAEIIALLRPRTVFSKGISGAGRWAVRYSDFGQPSFCAVLEGRCLLAVNEQEPATLEAGDFVLLPATPGFTISGFEPISAFVSRFPAVSKRIGVPPDEEKSSSCGGDTPNVGVWL